MLNIILFEGLSHTGKSTLLKHYKEHLESKGKKTYLLTVSNDNDKETTDEFKNKIMKEERRVDLAKVNKLLKHKAETRNHLVFARPLIEKYLEVRSQYEISLDSTYYEWVDKELLVCYLNLVNDIVFNKHQQFNQMIKLITRFGEDNAYLLVDRYFPSTLAYLPLDFYLANNYAYTRKEPQLVNLAIKVHRTYQNTLYQLKHFVQDEQDSIKVVWAYIHSSLENRIKYSKSIRGYYTETDKLYDEYSLDKSNHYLMNLKYQEFIRQYLSETDNRGEVIQLENNQELEQAKLNLTLSLDRILLP